MLVTQVFDDWPKQAINITILGFEPEPFPYSAFMRFTFVLRFRQNNFFTFNSHSPCLFARAPNQTRLPANSFPRPPNSPLFLLSVFLLYPSLFCPSPNKSLFRCKHTYYRLHGARHRPPYWGQLFEPFFFLFSLLYYPKVIFFFSLTSISCRSLSSPPPTTVNL